MPQANDPQCALLCLPDELLEAIVGHLPPYETLAFGTTCKRANKITYEPLIWRQHCIQTWKYWEDRHELDEKLELPPAQTKWRKLFNERRRIDRQAGELFDRLLTTQLQRLQNMEDIAKYGYDVKDLLRSLKEHTPDHADDVLARRFHASAILGQVHRATALDKWSRLHKRQMVKLEEVLGAYDLFVLSGNKGDLGDIGKEFDRIARCIRDEDPHFDSLTLRQRALQVARYLRLANLMGNPSEEDYHALRNNFISIALFDEVHTSLPLQSVAIYCAVARRLGINAKPSNYPSHVHAVVEAPPDMTLDGKHRTPIQGAEPELMHLDPWRSSEEVPLDLLRLRLLQMGAPPAQHAFHLGPTSNFEIALRTGRNIMNSVQEARDRIRGHGAPTAVHYPDVEAAWYAMVWSMVVLGDSNPTSNLARRRQCLPYLVEHFQAHFPEDLGLIEALVAPMFAEQREHHILLHMIAMARAADRSCTPRPRSDAAGHVRYRIGHHFSHRRYRYAGFIIGWDPRCAAETQWIERMRVDDLSGGRSQPFYNVVAEDKSVRYVAEENIAIEEQMPGEALMQLAGRYFKRWNADEKRFESNMKDEYPDD